MELYEEIKFKGLDFVYIGNTKDGRSKILLKNVLTEEQIKKYCEDDKYRDGNEVRHSFNLYPPFNWEDSYIKNVILPNFIKDLGLSEENVEATLLSKEEVESLPEDIKKCNAWYWTKSNASDENDKFAYAWFVGNDGYVNYSFMGMYSFAVRPVFYLDSTLICSDEAKQSDSNWETSKLVCKNKLKNITTLDDDCDYEDIVSRINEITDILKEMTK